MVPLRPHVNIRRPPLRYSWNLRPEFLNRRVERICDGVRVDHLVREQVFVEPLSHVGAIGIAHGPITPTSAVVSSRLQVHSPHRRDYALEAGMQHRSCKVNGLLRLLCVALGRLARRQIGEPRLAKVQIHELRNGELPVTEVETAIECARLILSAMACQMNKVGFLDAVGDAID
jgi:hypothetical protein